MDFKRQGCCSTHKNSTYTRNYEQNSMPFFYRKTPDSPLKTVQVHLFTDEASYLDNTRSDWSESAHVTSLDFLARHRVYLRVINYVIMRADRFKNHRSLKSGSGFTQTQNYSHKKLFKRLKKGLDIHLQNNKCASVFEFFLNTQTSRSALLDSNECCSLQDPYMYFWGSFILKFLIYTIYFVTSFRPYCMITCNYQEI